MSEFGQLVITTCLALHYVTNEAINISPNVSSHNWHIYNSDVCLYFEMFLYILLQLLDDSLENRLEKTGGFLSDSEKAEAENKEAEIDENKVHIFLIAFFFFI